VVVFLIPRRWRISVLGAVIVVVLAVCIRVQKLVNHLTYCWMPSFQRVRIHCRSLPQARCVVLVQTVVLHCFYILHTIFTNVASRQLDEGDNNKGRREKSIWRHWPCSPIGWYYVTRREQRETLNYMWVSLCNHMIAEIDRGWPETCWYGRPSCCWFSVKFHTKEDIPERLL
jgi:hypothetical protein